MLCEFGKVIELFGFCRSLASIQLDSPMMSIDDHELLPGRIGGPPDDAIALSHGEWSGDAPSPSKMAWGSNRFEAELERRVSSIKELREVVFTCPKADQELGLLEREGLENGNQVQEATCQPGGCD